MKFPTHAVLSTCTGRLMGDIGGVYKVTSFLIGRDAFTHELPYYGRRAEKALRAVLPELPGKNDFEHVNGDNYRDVLAEWEAKLGSEIDLPDSLRDSLADEKNAIGTLREMRPDADVIVVKL